MAAVDSRGVELGDCTVVATVFRSESRAQRQLDPRFGTEWRVEERSASGDFACFEARRADVEAVTIAGADFCPDGLNVRVPPAMCPPVRMRDRHAEARPLAADVAHGSHVTHSLGSSRGWYARFPGGRSEE